jgi:hypothetical protein
LEKRAIHHQLIGLLSILLSAFALSDSQAKNFHVSLFSFSPQRSNAILKTFFRVTRNHLM